MPHDFIKAFLKRNIGLLNTPQKKISNQDAVLRVHKDKLLASYYHSIRPALGEYATCHKIPRMEDIFRNLTLNFPT